MKLDKNQKIVLALVAVAAPLILASASYQTLATSTDTSQPINIDFAIYPANDITVVERGNIASIPLKVESPNGVDMTLQIRLTSYGGTIDPATLNAAVSKPTLVLSKLDVGTDKVTDIGSNRGIRDAGVLTVSIPSTMQAGTYTIGLEAVQKADGTFADELVSGSVVTIQVK